MMMQRETGGGELRLARKSEGEVGERAQGDDFDAGIGADRVDDCVGAVSGFGAAIGRRVAVIAEAVFAVKPVSGREFPAQGSIGPGIDRDIGATEFGGVQRVAGRLRERDVSGDDGDGGDANSGAAQGHDERDGVVGGGVGVDQEGARHDEVGPFLRTAVRRAIV